MNNDLIFYQFSRSKVEHVDFRHFLGLYAGCEHAASGRENQSGRYI